MNDRRYKRKQKKKMKKMIREEIPCIVLLATDEEHSEYVAEQKENRQLKVINEYADSHGLVPFIIMRTGCITDSCKRKIIQLCVYRMQTKKPKAVVLMDMKYISRGLADSYQKVGLIREAGFRIFTVNDGELKMNMKE